MELQPESRLAQLPLRKRGDYLNKFRSINVATNHFQVQVTSQFEEIHIFAIRFQPNIPFDNTQLRRQLIDSKRTAISAFIDNPVVSGNNIYSMTPPRQTQFEVEAGQYRIALKEVKVLQVKDNPKVLLSFLNNGLRSIMRKMNYMQIGRTGKYFNAQRKTNIDNLMMFSGYRSNFVHLEGGYYLRVDSAKKIVRNQTVLQFIDEVYRMHQSKPKQQRRDILVGELVGKIVMTNYGRTSYQKVEDVVFQDLESVQLDDAAINLREYYKTKYGIQIRSSKQPLLRAQSRKKGGKEYLTYLVPELCLMTGIPENFDQFRRKKISQNTIKRPEQKQRQILQLMRELRDNDEFKSFKEMGLKIGKDMQTVKGRLIPMPRINLGENNSVQQGKQAFFNLYDKPIFNSKHSIVCGIIYFSGQETRPLLDTFEKTSRNLKVKMENVKLNAGEYDSRRGLESIESMLKKAADREGCNICLIVLPNHMKTQYKRIKNLSLNKYKMVCQITTEGTLKKRNIQSVATKILLQIIAKRGNTLWVPRLPKDMPSTMIMAYQTSKDNHSTTLAVCATLNSTFSSMMSRVDSFRELQQKFNCMVRLGVQAAAAFVKRNKEPPQEIIIFSNSISGDQINMYINYYINPFQAQLKEAYPEKAPAVTFVMVNVKTAERFFVESHGVDNVPAGTVVANQVVSNYYDFYVVSQKSNRGSTVPNHYRVIYSDSKTEEGVLQELIFSQCFNYVNWTGSIKIPGILQYAGKCAKFNSQVLENEALAEQLQSKLYFV